MVNKTLHRKLNIEEHEHQLKPGWSTHVLPKGKHFLLYVWHPQVYSWYKPSDNEIVITTYGTCPWSFVTHIFHNGQACRLHYFECFFINRYKINNNE